MVDKIIDCGDIVGSVAKYATSIEDIRAAGRAAIIYMNVEGNEFVVKMSTYDNPGPLTVPAVKGITYLPAPDVEIAIMQQLRKKIIRKGITPCIAELLSSKICEGALGQATAWQDNEITLHNSLSPENILIRKLVFEYDMMQRGVVYDKVAFVAIEKLGTTLASYIAILRDDALGKTIILSLIWWIIYTFGAIQTVFPGFRHGDIHLGNIMIYSDWNYALDDGIKYIEVTVKGDKPSTYWIPYLGILPKLIDFGHSSMPSEGIASNYTLLPYYSDTKQDDLHHLLAFIYKNLVSRASNPSTRYLSTIINALSPQGYHSKMMPTAAPPPLDPFAMLDNEIFSEYRSPKSPSQIYSKYGVSRH